jgi:hypothetical protein
MKKKLTILTENPIHYPIAFLDYLYVITIYSITAFFCSVIIDGYIIPDFNLQIALKRSNIFLASQILLQLAVQGFIAIFLYALLQKIYSPFNGWYGYTSETPLGLTVRSPAIISVILFYLSTSLHDKLKILFNRFSNKPQTFGLIATNVSSNKKTTSNAPATKSDATDNTNTTDNTNPNSK